MRLITHTTQVAALSLLLCGSIFAQTIHIQVGVIASRLHADTESVQVLCRLENGKHSAKGHANLRVKNARAGSTINVPITINRALSGYKSVNCSLQMCKKGDADKCQTPLPSSKSIAKAEEYRAYDETADNQLAANQALNNPPLITTPASTSSGVTASPTSGVTGSTTSAGSALAAETSQVVTGVITTTETEIVVEEGAFQPNIIDVGQMEGIGIRFQPVTINTGQMVGTGIRFEPVTIKVGQMSGTGNRFQPITINTGQMEGTGTRFEPITINVGQMSGISFANSPHTITLNKSGAANGRMFAILEGPSIAASCLASCDTATSEPIEHGAIITINANEENLLSYQFGDNYAAFAGWAGDDICTENANGTQTSFPLNSDVTCTAQFYFIPHEMATITLKKARSSDSNGNGYLGAFNANDTYSGNNGVVNCPERCNSAISAPFPVGTAINVTHSTTDRQNQFDGWTDERDCSETFTLERNTVCTAKFKKVTPTGFTLTVAKVGNGEGIINIHHSGDSSASCGPGCDRIVINNLTIDQIPNADNVLTDWILTADSRIFIYLTAVSGSTFVELSGDAPCIGTMGPNSTMHWMGSNRIPTFYMDQDIYCTARFSKIDQTGSNQPQVITFDVEPVIDTDFSTDFIPIPMDIDPHIELTQ
ncbi:MAG: hypothetical protein L3J28_10815 [Candidatus Polarisedimenticolaceae bacterium]|nr:hypothetical protein [Candidatus Polarisedimenticolaceae bacterium]